MLEDNNVAARIPAQDLQRARSFYSSKLGLDPVEERPGASFTDVEVATLPCTNRLVCLRVRTRKWHGRSMILRLR
jgi:catechol 2,3-dioxygenase-like lactoylglutathione lyase family enzyme